MPRIFFLLTTFLLVQSFTQAVEARVVAAPAPEKIIVTDITMTNVGKRQSGGFSISWTPAKDAFGNDRTLYAVQTSGCDKVTDAKGTPLPPLNGSKFKALAGPPYAVHLSGCSCAAAARVLTAYEKPENSWSSPLIVAKGTIPFGPPCAPVTVAK